METWKSGYVTANGLKMHYTRTGGDKASLVLSHGITDDGLCWTPLAEALALDYDVIMIDARGHGRSDDPPHGYDSFTQAEDLAAVIAALGLENPIAMGHSMGAVTTLAFAGMHPEVPRAILLEDPPLRWMPPGESTSDALAAREYFRSSLAANKRKTQQELYNEQRQAAPTWSEAELRPWVESKQRFSPNILDIFTEHQDRVTEWQDVIERITCPALLIRADTELGGIVSAEDAAALEKLFNDRLKVVHVPGAGHNIRREQFECYLGVVHTFLSSL